MEMLLCAFGTLTAGADAWPGPSLSVSLCPWMLTVGARPPGSGDDHTTRSGSVSGQPLPDPEMTPASSARRGVVETPGGPASAPGHPEP